MCRGKIGKSENPRVEVQGCRMDFRSMKDEERRMSVKGHVSADWYPVVCRLNLRALFAIWPVSCVLFPFILSLGGGQFFKIILYCLFPFVFCWFNSPQYKRNWINRGGEKGEWVSAKRAKWKWCWNDFVTNKRMGKIRIWNKQ